MNKMTSYVKQVVAKLQGDDKEVTAQKVYRKASTSVASQIQAQKSAEVDQEEALENAQDALNNAKYPTSVPADGKEYIRGIQRAQEKVDAAQAALDQTRQNIKYFENLQKEFDATA